MYKGTKYITDMKINFICFTGTGINLALKIKNLMKADYDAKIWAKSEGFDEADYAKDVTCINDSLSDFVYERQTDKEILCFIGAVGIAVRMISKGIENKLNDAPVIVIDETAKFVIPILAGHYGGGNSLAMEISELIDAIPVITTATDNEGVFAADLFAKENNLSIINKDGIKKVSTKALEGKSVRLCIENFPAESVDVMVSSNKQYLQNGTLNLCPREYSLGIGCRKNTDSNTLREFVLSKLKAAGIEIYQIGAIGSIDLKADEKAILDFSKEFGIPFITFDAKILKTAKGNYEESDFVMEKTGVGNVCERAAMLLTNNCGRIVVGKTSHDGITVAVGKIRD